MKPAAFVRGGLLVFLLLLAITGLVACAPSAAGSEPVATTQITMAPSYRFDPVAIRVAEGATVTWTNKDNFTHNVRLVNGGWVSPPLKPGQSVSHTFAAAGEYPYVCDFHSQNMKGTVFVVGGK